MIDLKVRGLDRVKARLENIPKAMPKAMNAAVLYVHSRIPPYPSAPASSTYRRTGTLGRTITTMASGGGDALSRVEVESDRVRGIVGTRLNYAPFVIDKMRQAWMHSGRWWNLQDVIFGMKSDILRVYRDALIKFVR